MLQIIRILLTPQLNCRTPAPLLFTKNAAKSSKPSRLLMRLIIGRNFLFFDLPFMVLTYLEDENLRMLQSTSFLDPNMSIVASQAPPPLQFLLSCLHLSDVHLDSLLGCLLSILSPRVVNVRRGSVFFQRNRRNVVEIQVSHLQRFQTHLQSFQRLRGHLFFRRCLWHSGRSWRNAWKIRWRQLGTKRMAWILWKAWRVWIQLGWIHLLWGCAQRWKLGCLNSTTHRWNSWNKWNSWNSWKLLMLGCHGQWSFGWWHFIGASKSPCHLMKIGPSNHQNSLTSGSKP